MSRNQSPESWHGIEMDAIEETAVPSEQPVARYQQVVNDPVQRRVVEAALLSGGRVDVDPKIVQAMGLGPCKNTVDTSDIAAVKHTPQVPYGGTESVHDIPARVVVPDGVRANLPA